MAQMMFKGRLGDDGPICVGRDPENGRVRLELHATQAPQWFLSRDEAWHLADSLYRLLDTIRDETYPTLSLSGLSEK